MAKDAKTVKAAAKAAATEAAATAPAKVEQSIFAVVDARLQENKISRDGGKEIFRVELTAAHAAEIEGAAREGIRTDGTVWRGVIRGRHMPWWLPDEGTVTAGDLLVCSVRDGQATINVYSAE